MKLRPYQTEAVNAVYEYLRANNGNPCVVLPTGCHAKDHPILMYDGTIRKVQDVRVGDLVMGKDSTPRCVLALARGREPMARIIPLRGESFVVNINHLLSLVSTNEGKNTYPSQQRGGEITTITVSDYLTKSKSWRHLRKLYRVPVDFNRSVNLPIPPHILGLMLGDGTMTGTIALTSADEELGDEMIAYADSMNLRVRVRGKDSKAVNYAMADTKGASNALAGILHKLGLLGHTSRNKFIPHDYLTASRQDRLELLAGLLDSDGFYDLHCFEITTQSRELAGDIVFLARSLGFMANCIEKYSTCQTGAGGWYFRTHLSGDLSQLPCRRKRHVLKPRKQKKDVLRTGFSVELLPEDDFYGFELDGDQLYVDGHFMVHHNTGKSIVIAKVVQDAVSLWNGRVVILAHVKELLEQNADKIRRLCPNIPIGIYSAGLNSRDKHEDVIVAGIQSVYNKACELGSFDLVIVDEANSIAPDGDGMYRTFLKDMQVINPNVRLIGLTATPFRLKGGLICKPENFLNDVCYEAGLKEMIQQGYLSPLVARAGAAEADLDKLHIRGGEFVSDEVAAAMDVEELVDAACREIVALTRDRQSVLIFTAGVEHCQHVADKITCFSQSECAVVTGSTPATERAEFIARFRGELDNGDLFGHKLKPLKYLANVNVLTTGFDAPNTDCVVLLRPTNSPGLLIQMVGRGSRLSPATGKKDCLVLDYGGNILRHGPIDTIRVTDRTPGSGDAPAKKCPGCSLLIHAAYQTCPDCGWLFPPPERKNIDQTASRAGIISGEISYSEHQVASVHYSVHEKYGADESTPKTMRVDYEIEDRRYVAEWVCPEHTGYAREKFVRWWRARARENCPMPTTAAAAVALAEQECLAPALRIKLKYVSGEKYDRVVEHSLGEKPPWPPPPDNSADQWPPASIGYRSIPQWPPLPDCLRPLANTHAATAPSQHEPAYADAYDDSDLPF